ncbi:hypothetical protein K402DRAFT_411886 [Aulographum hederae CBS 113979]|uniref:mRNA 3'-end-processing protein RNA14 n=1 Tax=Aulographum hederae CBS 113979 TaxID=1176131 RepID=A0A6G1H2Z2_9PEZI|nr:hypothetical protein K402DRAFT_411886 [Aulographum hederae CBS 113979]
MAHLTDDMLLAQAKEAPADTPTITPQHLNVTEDDDEDYDPSSLMPDSTAIVAKAASDGSAPMEGTTSDSSAAPSRTASRESRASRASPDKSAEPLQPRTKGGFVIDDDDDDEEDEVPFPKPSVAGSSGLLDVAGSSTEAAQRTQSQTPNNATSQSDVSIQKAEDQEDPVPVSQPAAPDSVPPPTTASAATETGASQVDPVVSFPIPAQAPQTTKAKVVNSAPSLPKARLPHDTIGVLEDRIAEDPRGDMDAWLNLIFEFRNRNKTEEARSAYDRFFKVFPSSAEQWVAYATMELEQENLLQLEQIFTQSLAKVPNVQLWSMYLDYVRRRNNLTTDPTGTARQVISDAYEFVLGDIGMDMDSGPIWRDYVQFVKSGPGIVGGPSWQDQQKVDIVRRAYHKATAVPSQPLHALWKEYEQFETNLNKNTGRRFVVERSPMFVTARSAWQEWQNITTGLKRTTLPRLPPAPGFDGEAEFMHQVDLWKRWISWEKDDPLVLKLEDPAAYKKRVIHVFKQAFMALRFWPHIWYDAAEFCFQNDMKDEGNNFLVQGIAANPESCLLGFTYANRLEESTKGDSNHERRGQAVRAPYDKLLDALYALISATKTREEQNAARIQENFARQEEALAQDMDEDDDDAAAAAKARETALNLQLESLRAGSAVQIDLLKKTVTTVWTALMRAWRRVQGKGTGKVGDPVGGMRTIFQEARKRGNLTSDIYTACALMEHYCYMDNKATTIFERGTKLFPDDERFALAYLKHLLAINDPTNARAVFQTAVTRLTAKPEKVEKAKPLYAFFHEFESNYGELAQVVNLETRMKELFPNDPYLQLFAQRYSTPDFDPTAIRPIISPMTQARPRPPQALQGAGVQQAQLAQQPPAIQYNDSPRPLPAQISHYPVQQHSPSPKRPFIADALDAEPPRKFIRGESPLKGAAGRRLDAAKRNLQNASGGYGTPQMAPMPPPLPSHVNFLLSVIPNASKWDAPRFMPDKMMDLLRSVDLDKAKMVGGRRY